MGERENKERNGLLVPYHLLLEIYYHVLKPDRVACGGRVAWSLGKEMERWKRAVRFSSFFWPSFLRSSTALFDLLFQVPSLLVQEQSNEIKFMSSFRPLPMKCGCKYDFIIMFIQIISVFRAAQIPVYLTSIFAESFFAVTVGFLSSAFLIF